MPREGFEIGAVLGCPRTWRGRAPKSSGLTAYGRGCAAKSLIFQAKGEDRINSAWRDRSPRLGLVAGQFFNVYRFQMPALARTGLKLGGIFLALVVIFYCALYFIIQ